MCAHERHIHLSFILIVLYLTSARDYFYYTYTENESCFFFFGDRAFIINFSFAF